MAYSTQRAVSDGTMVRLDISIDYLDRDDITVFLNDAPIFPPRWDWIGTTDRAISFTPAIPAGDEVLVVRNTDLAQVLNRFSKLVLGGNAAFTSESVDANFRQLLLIAQEGKEGSTLSDVFQDLDMHLYRIKNLGRAVDPNDAVPMIQLQELSTGAWQAANAAAASATAAAGSATAAANSASAALASQNAAAASQTAAAGSASSASTSATTATNRANAAAASAAAALASEQAADADLKDMYKRHLGSFATPPTETPAGDPLEPGMLYFDTALGSLRVWSGSAWGSAGSTIESSMKIQSFLPTTGTTVIAIAGGYDPFFAMVHVNGVLMMQGVDVDLSNGTQITLTKPTEAGAEVVFVGFGAFNVADTYTRAQIDTKDAAVKSAVLSQVILPRYSPTFSPTTVGAIQTWTVPADVYKVLAEGSGGGGGGGGGSGFPAGALGQRYNGGGGGAGDWTRAYEITVTPGEVLEVIVGLGGTSGVGGAPSVQGGTGGTGGTTTIRRQGGAVLLNMAGGGGGSGGAAGGPAPGGVGFTNGGMGMCGVYDAGNGAWVLAGHGGANPFGQGGPANANYGVGNAGGVGAGYGAGGGGGCSPTVSGNGGVGAPGRGGFVRFYW